MDFGFPVSLVQARPDHKRIAREANPQDLQRMQFCLQFFFIWKSIEKNNRLWQCRFEKRTQFLRLSEHLCQIDLYMRTQVHDPPSVKESIILALRVAKHNGQCIIWINNRITAKYNSVFCHSLNQVNFFVTNFSSEYKWSDMAGRETPLKMLHEVTETRISIGGETTSQPWNMQVFVGAFKGKEKNSDTKQRQEKNSKMGLKQQLSCTFWLFYFWFVWLPTPPQSLFPYTKEKKLKLRTHLVNPQRQNVWARERSSWRVQP